MKLFGNAFDAVLLALSAQPGDAVRRDTHGVPTAFRIFSPGPVSITRDGARLSGVVTPEDIAAFVSYHQTKGVDIPVDCEHLLQILADAKGVSESELIAADPILGEKASAGMVSLTEENGELWANVSRWSARARQLLAGAADKIYSYFSPVIRGLKDGPLRITSIALTNYPAIDDQQMIAASDSVAGLSGLPRFAVSEHQTPNRSQSMEHLKKLAQLLGLDAAALTGEKADLSGLFQKALAAIEADRKAIADFISGIKSPLALTDADSSLQSILGKVLSAVEKGKSDSAALTDLQTRLSGLEGKDRDRFVAELKAQGKLTEAMLPWASKQSVAALTDFAATAPVIVPPTRIVNAGDATPAEDSLALTDADKAIGRRMGHSEEEIAKANNLKI